MKRHRTHRRILTLLIALALCAALLVGCDGAPTGPVYTFTEFLDREGFTEQLNQWDFEQKMKTYTVDGETLWDLVGAGYGCGDVNYMILGRGELYGYEHSSSTYEDHSSLSYSVYTSVLFDGFVLPYGLAFGDSLDTAARRLELASSPLKNFAPDDADVPYRMTVREDGNTSLVFENLLLNPNVSKTAYPFTLIYKETSEETNEAGERVEIWREVKLSFDGDARLGRIAFKRGQTRTFATEDVPEGPMVTFTEFLDREGFTEHLNRMDFEQKMEAYIVDGEALWGLVGPSYMCGDVNNMLFGWGELYGYEHSSSRYEDRLVSTYSVYTDVLFDGFTLPYGLAYGNSLETVARRLGLDASPLENFTPDDADEPYLMTLWQKEDASLTFEDLRQMPHLTTTRPFILTYTETSEETNEAGERVEIRREVELRFDEDATLRTISFERGQTRYYATEEGTPE